MKALRTIFALAALALVGSALALVQPQGYAGKSLLRAANSVSFRGSSEGSSAFSPTDIAGLKLWLDASQIVGLNDGDAVATWSDLSGNGNNATQATASSRPTYQTNELNGLPVVRFDGVDDWIAKTGGSYTGTQLWAFAVVKRTAGVKVPLSLSDDGVADYLSAAYAEVFRNGIGDFGAYRNGGLAGAAYSAGWKIQVQVWDGVDFTPRVNGVASASTASSGTFNFNQILIGAYQDTGPKGAFFSDDIAEIGFGIGPISAQQIVALENYLNTKWAVY